MLKEPLNIVQELIRSEISLQFEDSSHTTGIETLLTSSFPVLKGQSFYSDFPIWDPQFGANLCRIVAVDGDLVVATAGIRYARSKETKQLFGFIGGVATHSNYRGKGLASLCVSRLIDIAESKQPEALFLWGSEYELYNRLGFEMYGLQLRVKLNTVLQSWTVLGEARLDDTNYNIGRGWVKGLEEVLLNRTHGLDITPQDLSWIQAHKNIDWWWTGSPSKVTAFAASGRGMDLNNIIHEWGGEKSALHVLLRSMASKTPDLQIIGNENIYKSFGLSEAVSTGEREFLCMFKPLHGQELSESIWFWGLDGC